MTFYPADKKLKPMKKLPGKISQATVIVVLYLFTFPCLGEVFLWEISSSDFSYAEHLEWQRSFQWERKQAFQIYKRDYNRYQNQKKKHLQKRLRETKRGTSDRLQSLFKKRWETEQRTYQVTRLKITKEYIKNKNQSRKQKKSRGSILKRTKHSREFVL